MTDSPVIGVLALQGDVREHLRALREAGVRPVAIRRPDELDAVDGLVIPGGESTTIWKLAAAFELMDPVRKRIAAGMPAFGSCAGMIMLADRVLDGAPGQQTFGGIDMTVRRNAFGRQVDSFEADLDITGVDQASPHAGQPAVLARGDALSPRGAPPDPHGPEPPAPPLAAVLARGDALSPWGAPPDPYGPELPAPSPPAKFHAVFIRAPWVESVGPAVEILGRDGSTGRIVAVRQGPLLATSFHPELSGDVRVHRLFADIVKGRS